MTRRQRRHKGIEKPVVPLSPANGHPQCGGKPCYSGFAQANRMADNASRHLAGSFQPYRCKQCCWWHVGANVIGNRRFGRKPKSR